MQRLMLILIGLVGIVGSKAAYGEDLETLFNKGKQALIAEEIESAQKISGQLTEKYPKALKTRLLKAQVAFHQGDYKAAYRQIKPDFQECLKQDSYTAYLCQLIKNTALLTAAYQTSSSPDRRITVRYSKGPDRILAPYIFQAIQKANQALAAIFEYSPRPKLHIDIYPEAAVLAQVSGLTPLDIERTGTVALCKYNRLMITSPLAMLYGYRWLDTLNHEYVHYLLMKMTGNRLSLWLHEGLAKYFEASWRKIERPGLEPTYWGILKEALDKDRLITFAQMYPSFAKLLSQREAALAFAIVYTMIEYLVQQKGLEGLRRILKAIKNGVSDKAAIEQVLQLPFDRFLAEWKQYARNRVKEKQKGLGFYGIILKKGGQDPFSLSDKKAYSTARRFVRLGELLETRKRYYAAAKEYQKAKNCLKETNPYVQNLVARALNKSGKYPEAIAELKAVKKIYPSYLKTWLNLGEAYYLLRQYPKALEFYSQAMAINPFHPEVHYYLAEIYKNLKDAKRAAFEQDQYELLTQ